MHGIMTKKVVHLMVARKQRDEEIDILNFTSREHPL
jgi:hypothetical protein